MSRQHSQNHPTGLDSQAAELTSLRTKLDVLQKELVVNARQDRILRSLYFPEIRRRLDQIETSHQGSNEWIFDPKSTSFVPWLESNGNTDQIFYVTGQVCLSILCISFIADTI
jgi:hypothetical protein